MVALDHCDLGTQKVRFLHGCAPAKIRVLDRIVEDIFRLESPERPLGSGDRGPAQCELLIVAERPSHAPPPWITPWRLVHSARPNCDSRPISCQSLQTTKALVHMPDWAPMPTFEWPTIQEFIVFIFSPSNRIRHDRKIATRMFDPAIKPRVENERNWVLPYGAKLRMLHYQDRKTGIHRRQL